MSRIETINQQLLDAGFVINDHEYIFEKMVQTGYMIINGVKHVQEEKRVLKMEYIGDGCEIDCDGNDIEDADFCGFDIKDENGYSLTTIYITNIDDLIFYVNI